MSTRDERNARYRANLCVDCGEVEHSAGRPRCDNCHDKYLRNPLGDNQNA
ncbi:hypothetical protein [Mycobacterium sp. TY815]|nr:hypothetical protein [Mycobacterium sp. TY815]MDP7703210.1 hypothetical protein [Mycobacterium sp. TY815]